jgi:hypothetical protein
MPKDFIPLEGASTDQNLFLAVAALLVGSAKLVENAETY